MIILKTDKDIEKMRRAGALASAARKLAGEMIRPGITTNAIDREIREYLRSNGATPSFLGYQGFPAAVCISVNDEVIHGIPSARKLVEGDLVSVDVGAYIDGFHGDCAATFIVGECLPEHKRLTEVCRNSFYAGLEFARADARVGDVSKAVQDYVEQHGYSVVRKFVGHGIGRSMHEPPEIPHFVDPKRRGVRFAPGMTFAIEPMINIGTDDVYVAADKWTVRTADGLYSAHYENTVLVTDSEAELLTPPVGDR